MLRSRLGLLRKLLIVDSSIIRIIITLKNFRFWDERGLGWGGVGGTGSGFHVLVRLRVYSTPAGPHAHALLDTKHDSSMVLRMSQQRWNDQQFLLHLLHGEEGLPHSLPVVLDWPIPPLLEVERRILNQEKGAKK